MPVAGRAADHRNAAQSVMNGAGHVLLVAAQAVDQQQGEAAVGVEGFHPLGQTLTQSVGKRLAAPIIQPGYALDQSSLIDQVVSPQGQPRDAVFHVAQRADLAGGGAADQRQRAELGGADEAPGHRSRSGWRRKTRASPAWSWAIDCHNSAAAAAGSRWAENPMRTCGSHAKTVSVAGWIMPNTA